MMKMMMSSMTTMTRMSSKLGAVSGLFRNRWRQLSVLFSVLVAARVVYVDIPAVPGDNLYLLEPFDHHHLGVGLGCNCGPITF